MHDAKSPDRTQKQESQSARPVGAGAQGLAGDRSVADRQHSGSGASPRRHRPRRIPPKLYRIGEVVEYANVSRQTVHNYTAMGVLRESRWTAGGHRLYDERVFERLDTVAQLKAQRKSMQQIREHFARLDGEEAGAVQGAGRDQSE